MAPINNRRSNKIPDWTDAGLIDTEISLIILFYEILITKRYGLVLGLEKLKFFWIPKKLSRLILKKEG